MEVRDNPNYYFSDKPYKSKYICPSCRKAFKRKELSDITGDKEAEEKPPKCSQCGNKTFWIGPKFRAPKTTNTKAWNSVRILADVGVLDFHGWANVPIRIPETSRSLSVFLQEIKKRYEESIEMWIRLEYRKNNKNQIKYLSDAIRKIDKYLRKS